MNPDFVILLIGPSLFLIVDLFLNWKKYSENIPIFIALLNLCFALLVIEVVLIKEIHSLNVFGVIIPLAVLSLSYQGLRFKVSNSISVKKYNILFLNCFCIILILVLLARFASI